MKTSAGGPHGHKVHNPFTPYGQNLPGDPLIENWKVWFAWHPVPVASLGVRRYPARDVGDLYITRWVWLRNVARRRNETWVRVGAAGQWEYAPAHKALTQ